MDDADTRIGQQLLQFVRGFFDGLDFVVQEINLPAALEFALAAFDDAVRIPARYESLDRVSLHRRCGDNRQIAHARQRHVERARNRRRRHRQQIHAGAQRLQLFLVADAETMLLVDDDQPQVLILDGVRQQLVRADNDIDLACGEFGQCLVELGLVR